MFKKLEKTSRILLAFSTEFETRAFKKRLLEEGYLQTENCYTRNGLEVIVMVTGIGIAAMTYHLTKALEGQSYRLVINAGIGGSFTDRFPIGTCVRIVNEAFADLGMTGSDGRFIKLYDELPADKDTPPFRNGEIRMPDVERFSYDLPKAIGITVQNCSGSPDQIQFRAEHFKAEIESMEGAAAAFVCLSEGIDFIEIRAVSNRIEARDKSKWDIPKALTGLSDCLIAILLNIETNYYINKE